MRVPHVLIALIAMTSSPVMAKLLPEAPNFHEGVAVVEINGRMGYIDKTDEWVIPPTFDRAKRFSEGLAAVKEGAAVINIHMVKSKARQEMEKGGGSTLLSRKD